ncbi:efflux RND transporter periplasmic adaptor subunit [Methylocystis parvus]|uniref:Efflux RND transporter periplasmic adaptor subunit n=1 Tax=Methylocystis parvus TaxID=134 RepID=A0A6B8M1B8_9HYPH|nr:efflux RND transporter periplasmic adaptor subunit [Methylocystis parvus]QGM97594.1 efflux RND transporter periplasmic adaptor subunit [Methylocystis parvus]WBJ98474.1 efflux RND transporter periplasmic adaptor subunit [Methylocystis parvus OBBP]
MDWTRLRAIPRLAWITFGLLVLGGAALFRTGVSAQDETPAAPPPPAVTVAHPLAEIVPRWDEYTGRFVPVQRVEVRPRVSGAVEKIHFTDGQIVKAGDLLFTIDQRPYQIAVDSARAEVVRMQAQTAMLSKDAARGESLVGGGTITRRDMDQRRGGSDSARAQLLGAEASLRNAELNLEWTQVRAPISGRVSDRRIDVGNLVQGGVTLLTTIVSLDPIHFEFDVSESDFLHYARSGAARHKSDKTPAFVRLADEIDWKRMGSVDFLDNQLNARSGTIRARAILENKDFFLTPGAFGRVRINGGDLAALLIPDAAIASDQTNKIVMIVTPDHKVAAKPVALGPLHKGLRVVLSGLDAKDLVITAGLANPMVRPGATVAPTESVIAPLAN